MAKWRIGDSIEHPVHGSGTVTFVGADHVGVSFASAGEALLRCADLEAALHDPPQDTATIAPPLPWPDDTFLADDLAERHDATSHWIPFVADPNEIRRQLPDWLPKMEVFRAYGDLRPPRRAMPAAWPTGVALCWPDVHAGAIAVLRTHEGRNELVALFPYFERGTQVRLRLNAVRVMQSGVTAQIEARWGEAAIAFHDAAFLANRGWCTAGAAFDFILVGIAYAAGPAKVMRLPFRPPPDQLAWQALLAETQGEAAPAPTELCLEGMAMLLPIDDWDRDDYSFRGSVKAVEEVSGGLLDQPTWRLVVTVLRDLADGESDMDLAILITRRVWEGDQPPAVGMEIEGNLWLQGRLWMPLGDKPAGRQSRKGGST